jgi:hypothetical protein
VSVTLRFHGRFLYGQHENGSFSVMAPAFKDPFKTHHPLMSIAHDYLCFLADDVGDGRRPVTTLDPWFRIASHSDDSNPQVLVWNLNGLNVSYQGEEKVTLPQQPAIPDLAVLEEARHAPAPKVSEAALTARADGPTSAIVNVTAGRGDAVASAPSPTHFIVAKDHDTPGAPLAATADGKSDLTILPADLIKFSVEPRTTDEGTFLALEFSRGTERVGTVAVKDGGTISFSNLCSPIAIPASTDLEFTRYYDLLENSPGDSGLVPRDATGGSEGSCCVCKARAKTGR